MHRSLYSIKWEVTKWPSETFLWTTVFGYICIYLNIYLCVTCMHWCNCRYGVHCHKKSSHWIYSKCAIAVWNTFKWQILTFRSFGWLFNELENALKTWNPDSHIRTSLCYSAYVICLHLLRLAVAALRLRRFVIVAAVTTWRRSQHARGDFNNLWLLNSRFYV